MNELNAAELLLKEQYANASKFNARIYLHSTFSQNTNPWPCWIWDQLDKSDIANVLELGCGNGLLWRANSPNIPKNWSVTLSDYSQGMLKDAETALKHLEHEIRYELIDAAKIPYPDNHFDLVIANHMLYHVSDLKQVLTEIRRVLKPGGVLCSSTIGSDNMREMKELTLSFDPMSQYGDVLGGIESRFSLDNGDEHLNELFDSVEIRRYPNILSVSEPEAIINYLLSYSGLDNNKIVLDPNKVPMFREFIESKFEDGPFDITIDSGLFISYKD
jgi:SAM-dependent methyltransferase